MSFWHHFDVILVSFKAFNVNLQLLTDKGGGPYGIVLEIWFDCIISTDQRERDAVDEDGNAGKWHGRLR